MSQGPARPARLASLVGTLLIAAVAACLVAFSLVAQHAAQQSPGAPEVRPVVPKAGQGDPLEVGRIPAPEQPSPSESPEERIDDLLALAEEQPASDASIEQRELRDTPSRRHEPPPRPENPCSGRACEPRDPQPPVAPPEPAGPEPEAEADRHCGNGHFKGRGKGHEKGKGKGHCEHGGSDEGDWTPPGHAGGPGKSKGSGHPGNGHGQSKGSDHPGNGHGKSKGSGHPGNGHGKSKGSDHPGNGHGKSKGSDHPGNGHGKSKGSDHPGNGHGNSKGSGHPGNGKGKSKN